MRFQVKTCVIYIYQCNDLLNELEMKVLQLSVEIWLKTVGNTYDNIWMKRKCS